MMKHRAKKRLCTVFAIFAMLLSSGASLILAQPGQYSGAHVLVYLNNMTHGSVALKGSRSFLSGSLFRQQPVASDPKKRADIEIAGFESADADWTCSGRAFQSLRTPGTLPNQQTVNGHSGKYLLNSYQGGDAATGKAESASFAIQRDYVSFRVGGGNSVTKIGVRLTIDGVKFAEISGRNTEALEYVSWYVRRFSGRNARFEVYDNSSEGWGHILADDFIQTDAPRAPASPQVRHNYLVVPIYFDDTVGKGGHDRSYFERMVGKSWPGLNYYFPLISGGLLTLDGTRVLDFHRFPGASSGYMKSESYNPAVTSSQRTWDFKKLADTMQQYYGSEFKTEQYYGIVFCPNVCDEFGGGAATWIERPVNGRSVLYPVAFLNPTQGQGVWLHEFSHHCGIGHIRKNYSNKSEDQFSGMSGDGRDPVVEPFDRVGRGHMAIHLRDARWLTQDQFLYVLPEKDHVKFDLTSLYAAKHNEGIRAIIVPIDTSLHRFFIIESRRFSGVDKPGQVRNEGVAIHYMDLDENLWEPMPIYGPSSFGEFAPGTKLTSDNGNVTIDVLAKTSTGYTIEIRVGDFGASNLRS